MRVAYLTSNLIPISPKTKKGTEVFGRILLNRMSEMQVSDLDMTVFASEDSQVPFPLESITPHSSLFSCLPVRDRIPFELALLSKAFTQQHNFDLYHGNIGNGDIIVPFAPFVDKPILITIHYNVEREFFKPYFDIFKEYKNIYFVSVSDLQRTSLPNVQYAATIPHGVEEVFFSFDENGGEKMLWVGRGIPVKGIVTAFEVIRKTNRPLHACIIRKEGFLEWIDETIQSNHLPENVFSLSYDVVRENLISYYQHSKLFLFPIQHEEIFGLVCIESMSCGTPVVAFARGAMPEVIKDGETGFLVNPSDDDIRGDFIIKKTGVEGLVEAVERIYALNHDSYRAMRKRCRKLVEEKFTARRMAQQYIEIYRKLS